MYCESEEYNWREGDKERETGKEERFGSITLTLFLRSLGCKGGFLWFELGDDSLSKLYILGSCKINSESGSSTLKTALIKASSNRSLIRDINIYIVFGLVLKRCSSSERKCGRVSALCVFIHYLNCLRRCSNE